MYAAFAEMSRVELTLYTNALETRGFVRTRQHRITDILNTAEQPFLVLEDVTVRELGSAEPPITAAFAHINLDSVLFAVADTPSNTIPELRTPKRAEPAIVSVPPFRIVGTIHLLPDENGLRGGLNELYGHFLPVTEAVFWSNRLGEAKREAMLVAVNHHRTQILAQLGEAET